MAAAFADAGSTRPIPPPSRLLALTEPFRALGELAALTWTAPLLMTAPRGDGHPVLVLPGFVTTDRSTRILRRYLKALGHDVHAWELGRNLGPRAIGRDGEHLIARLEAVHEATGKTVSLVGWSLGGVMARLLAAWRPDLVRSVITLGSPCGGDPRASTVWRTYEALTGQRIADPHTRSQLEQVASAPSMPTTAIYTKRDGIVAWQNCRCGGEATDNIEVYGSHVGLRVNPSVLYAVADRLARPEGSHTPFEHKGFSGLAYPPVDSAP